MVNPVCTERILYCLCVTFLLALYSCLFFGAIYLNGFVINYFIFHYYFFSNLLEDSEWATPVLFLIIFLLTLALLGLLLRLYNCWDGNKQRLKEETECQIEESLIRQRYGEVKRQQNLSLSEMIGPRATHQQKEGRKEGEKEALEGRPLDGANANEGGQQSVGIKTLLF